MKRLETYLKCHAQDHGSHIAFICGNNVLTYSGLWMEIIKRVVEIKEFNGRGVVEKCSQSLDFIVNYFAAHLAGKAFVPLEKDIPQERYSEIERIVAESSIPDDVADILFTTGTTGKQKGVMISNVAILANAENLIDAQGFCKDHTFIICGPLNHIGSLSKIWPMMVVGGTVVITNGIKDINTFFKVVKCRKDMLATFLVPANIRILLKFEIERLKAVANKFDFIETGAAPMSTSDMEDFARLFPNTRLYNTYASTETGIVATHDYCHQGCLKGCLGHAMKNAEIIITDDGYISCRGPMIMSGYVGDENLTNQVLKEGILYTSDMGFLDNENRLRLTGRKGDVINIGGYKVMPTEVEEATLACPGVTDCICIRAIHPIVGNILKLLYVTDNDSEEIQTRLILHLKQCLESYKIPHIYEKTNKIERTYNGKLNRKFYEEK